MLATVALLVACGPAEEIGPDAGEEVDASLDGAFIEGQWFVTVHITGCDATEWTVPSFDIEVESDGDVVTTCVDCTAIDVTVTDTETMHADVAKELTADTVVYVNIDGFDDGATATASAHLEVRNSSGTICATDDPAATVTRVRE